MNHFIKNHLFNNQILVSGHIADEEEIATCAYCLAKQYGIKITDGAELLNNDVVEFVNQHLCDEAVDDTFYRDFPRSLDFMTDEMKVIDQLIGYCHIFENRSIFEDEYHDLIEKVAISEEDRVIKKFIVLNEKEANLAAMHLANDLCLSTRPLNNEQFLFVEAVIVENGNYIPENIASKDTAIRLLAGTRNVGYTKFIELHDVLRILEQIPGGWNLKKLCLHSPERKFMTNTLDLVFVALDRDYNANIEIENCLERKKIWNGFLHHIHYKPKCCAAQKFVDEVRSKQNHSTMSAFEGLLDEGYTTLAISKLADNHGVGAVARNLNYILSKTIDDEYVRNSIINAACKANPIILMQNVMAYNDYDPTRRRTFMFHKDGLMKKHEETDEEMMHRKSGLDPHVVEQIKRVMSTNISEHYLNCNIDKKIFISREMNKVALPIFNSTANPGLGVLPSGSRVPINGKGVRAFVYWEKVNDIDLSCFGLHDNGSIDEFSWRSQASMGDVVKFSGDVTRGYNGGSEYFDIDLEKFKERYPFSRYIIFCANVFSGSPFSSCFCKAGFMLRDDLSAGEIYEPKTVASSFNVDNNSTFAGLFAIDLYTNEMVWLNVSLDRNNRIAGEENVAALKKFLNVPFSYAFLFSRLGQWCEAEDADIIVSDTVEPKDGQELIRSCDIDKVLKYMNL